MSSGSEEEVPASTATVKDKTQKRSRHRSHSPSPAPSPHSSDSEKQSRSRRKHKKVQISSHTLQHAMYSVYIHECQVNSIFPIQKSKKKRHHTVSLPSNQGTVHCVHCMLLMYTHCKLLINALSIEAHRCIF